MFPTMLKRSAISAILVAWMLAATTGCGVKQSEYDAKVAEAKNEADKVAQLQKDLDAVKGDIAQSKEARKKRAEDKAKAIEQENAALKDQVKAAEQARANLKTKTDATVAQLRQELTAAKNALARTEQAKKAAENRIKALEQENAELKKKGSKPLDFLKR